MIWAHLGQIITPICKNSLSLYSIQGFMVNSCFLENLKVFYRLDKLGPIILPRCLLVFFLNFLLTKPLQTITTNKMPRAVRGPLPILVPNIPLSTIANFISRHPSRMRPLHKIHNRENRQRG